MTPHVTEDQMVALLQGALATDARDEVKRHLQACDSCADALGREAALDVLLWEARQALPAIDVVATTARAPADRPGARPRPRRRGPARWWAGAATAIAVATAIGYAGSAGRSSSLGAAAAGNPLAWQNVIFYIPIAVGLLLILGAAIGHHHEPGQHAGHAGHDGGHHEHDSLFARAFAVLGVGRVPLTVILMIAALCFGGLGIILNALLVSIGLAPAVYGPISIAGALVGMVALTGTTARLIHRHLPTTESYPITRHDFAGCTGTLLLPADASSGYAQVKDPEGNVHNIKCRTTGGALAKGTAILVVEYDEDARTFVIDANPEAPPT
ncbi:MAG TPA: hypothetical protein VFK02_35540 [Kofleriaceae bacterium]|nr:hypothetical protein [Kofleriaceae bacterium]